MGERKPGYVHQKTSGGFYTSGPAKDERAKGGRFISTGDNQGNKTSRTYDKSGKLVDKQVKGTGGQSRDHRD
jgi:hypothetical protein